MDPPGMGRTKTPPGQANPTGGAAGEEDPTTTSSSSSSSSSSSTTTTTTSSSTTSSTTTTTTTPRSTSTTQSSREIVTTAVITPTTVVVVGTSTLTSTLAPSTISSATLVPANESTGGSSLSSGARAGIIAGSVVGGVALVALIVGFCFCCGPCAGGRKRRKQKKDEDEAIRWPEIAASAEDRAALYPEPIHKTGRAGIGADEMEEVGAAGLGGLAAGGAAGAYAASRYPSTNRGPTLPSVPPSVYDNEYAGGAGRAYSPPPVGPQHSYLNEAAVAPGPAAIDYQRTTPSPPRTYVPSGSESDHPMLGSPTNGNGNGFGHDVPPGAGALPLPGSDDGGHHSQYATDPIDRPLSPREIGGGYAGGYDQDGADGGRWRLSVVNDDPRDPYYQR